MNKTDLQVVSLYCPICRFLFNRFGHDAQGSIYAYCSNCREQRVVKIHEGKLVIELDLAPVYTRAEKPGVSHESG
jgi:hypothetical protein